MENSCSSTHTYFDTILISIFILFFVCLAGFLSYFGNPIGDESFPFAIAYRFIKGQRPFVDDLSPFITIGLVLTPLVKLSLLWHQGKDELILFMRHAFILFEILMGLYLYSSTHKYLTSVLAGFVAIFVAVYHPFGIHNFHYDSLMVTFWSVILFQVFAFSQQKQQSITTLSGFASMNLALCFIYPTFIAVILPLLIIVHFLMANKLMYWTVSSCLLVVAGSGLVWLIFDYYAVTYPDIINTIQYWRTIFELGSSQLGAVGKYVYVVEHILATYQKFIALAFICVNTAYIFRRSILFLTLALGAALYLPLLHITLKYAVFSDTFYFLNCAGFLAPLVFAFFLRDNHVARALFLFVWLPALLGGLLTATTSSNLDLNFNLGFFPATLLGFVFVFFVLKDRAGYVVSRLPLIYGFLMLAFLSLNYLYGSTNPGINQFIMAKKITTPGPFHGIHIDYYWYDNLKNMQTDIEKIDTNPNKFIYFGPLSGGYLLTDKLKPGEYFLFGLYRLGHFGKPVRMPSYMVIDHSRLQKSLAEESRVYLQGTKNEKVVEKQNYDIFYVHA